MQDAEGVKVVTEEQLQEIQARNQQLLDDGILLFRQDIESSMKLVEEVERLRNALENAQAEIIPIRGYERKDVDGITSICIKIRKVIDGEEWE